MRPSRHIITEARVGRVEIGSYEAWFETPGGFSVVDDPRYALNQPDAEGYEPPDTGPTHIAVWNANGAIYYVNILDGTFTQQYANATLVGSTSAYRGESSMENVAPDTFWVCHYLNMDLAVKKVSPGAFATVFQSGGSVESGFVYDPNRNVYYAVNTSGTGVKVVSPDGVIQSTLANTSGSFYGIGINETTDKLLLVRRRFASSRDWADFYIYDLAAGTLSGVLFSGGGTQNQGRSVHAARRCILLDDDSFLYGISAETGLMRVPATHNSKTQVYPSVTAIWRMPDGRYMVSEGTSIDIIDSSFNHVQQVFLDDAMANSTIIQFCPLRF